MPQATDLPLLIIVDASPEPLPIVVDTSPQPLQVYHRRRKSPVVDVHVAPTPSSEDPSLELSIAKRKGKHSCTQHPIANFASFRRLSSMSHAFAQSLYVFTIPKSYKDALSSNG